MSERAGEPSPAGKPSSPTRNPLICRKVFNHFLAGFAVTAVTFLGTGTASASEPLVVDSSIGVEEAEAGQEIAIAPSAMDTKVREAVLLAMPLAFGEAEQASERFAAQSPIALGTASEGVNVYSGNEIAEAAKHRIAQLGLPEDKVESVSRHFEALVSVGNQLTVRAEEKQEQPPPPPESEPSPQPEPEPKPAPAPPPSESPEPEPAPAPPPEQSSGATPSVYPGYGASAPVRVMPPNYAYVPGTVPPWAARGQAPGSSPEVGELLKRSAEQKAAAGQRGLQQQQEVRAAGNAEAMPTSASSRVALPVLIGAVSLAAVTAALVRTWVLRRN